MKKDKEDEILLEMYRRAYKASTPSGDFDKMLAEAEINELGQKVIPFNDYECEMEVLEQIVKDVIKEYKVPKHRQEAFRVSFMLGCSPKTKRNVEQV